MRVRMVIAACVIAAATGFSGAAQATAASNVVQVNVAGQSTTIYGVLEGLPSLGATAGYSAGAGPAAQITAYYNSGQYAADQASVAAAAQSYFTSWMKSNCSSAQNCAGKKPAAVFDIDDTLVSWYAGYAAGGFATLVQSDGNASGPCTAPIAPVISFLNYVKSKGVAVYLISGRQSANGGQAAAVACLSQIGVTGYTGLVLRSGATANVTAQQYKSQARAQIQQSGYTIITAIGDQVSDSAGGSTTRGFLLPNPMYYIP